MVPPASGALLQELYTRDGAGLLISRDMWVSLSVSFFFSRVREKKTLQFHFICSRCVGLSYCASFRVHRFRLPNVIDFVHGEAITQGGLAVNDVTCKSRCREPLAISASSSPCSCSSSCRMWIILSSRHTPTRSVGRFRTPRHCLIRPSAPFPFRVPPPLLPRTSLHPCRVISSHLTSSSYDGIRLANPGDIPGIREIIAPLEEAGWVFSGDPLALALLSYVGWLNASLWV